MSLNKNHLINSIHNHLSIPKSKSTPLVESVLEIIKTSLANGEDVLISRFGKFYVKEKNERRGRNPATGEDMKLRSRRVVTFGSAARLKNKINGKDK
jgi:integration host factor subunit alpha